jgi:thiol:disulfide interchange protein DsbC
MFNRCPTFLAATLCCLLASSLALADAATDRVREGIKRHTGGDVQVDRVSATPIPGIFEVVSGTDVFYSDASGRYAFVDGRLVDTEKKRDLTQPTLESLTNTNVDFKSLPLELAIKTVTGTGKRQLAIFEDPACPVCQRLHGALAQLKDVTVYTFAYPIISEQSIPAAIATLCAPVSARSAKWNAFMAGAPLPDRLETGCDKAQADVGRIIALGEKYRIKNTPTLILGNGKRIVGGIPPDQLAAALDELGQ